MNKENIKLYPPHIYLFAFYQKDKSTSFKSINKMGGKNHRYCQGVGSRE
jgi:hypothetical protein